MKIIDWIFFILISAVTWGLCINDHYLADAHFALGKTIAAVEIDKSAKAADINLQERVDTELVQDLIFKHKSQALTASVHGLGQFVGFVAIQILLILWVVARIFIGKNGNPWSRRYV